MKLTKREIWALRQMLTFDITRYLLANTFGRLDGEEKADRHIHMSKILCRFVFAEGGEYKFSRKESETWHKVHDYLAEILTDRMDEVIGFPLTTPLMGDEFDEYVQKFFDVIINNMSNIEKVAKDCWKRRNC